MKHEKQTQRKKETDLHRQWSGYNSSVILCSLESLNSLSQASFSINPEAGIVLNVGE